MKKLALVFLVAAGFFLWALQTFYEIPILMYHRIDTAVQKSSVCVSPENFERQMEFLKVHRYHVIPLEELIREVKAGKPIPRKTVSITFDDGTSDNFRHAFPVLHKLGLPATLFMITDNINRPGWLSEEDLKILDESGIRIGSHTEHHTFLPELDSSEVPQELANSKRRLENILGHPITLFSYPAGGMTPQIERQVQAAGYEGAVTTNYDVKRNDPWAMRRVKIADSSGNLFSFWLKTSGFYSLGKKRVLVPTQASHPNDWTNE